MMVFMPLVLVWIGQFCGDVIGRQNVKVAVIGRLFISCAVWEKRQTLHQCLYISSDTRMHTRVRRKRAGARHSKGLHNGPFTLAIFAAILAAI